MRQRDERILQGLGSFFRGDTGFLSPLKRVGFRPKRFCDGDLGPVGDVHRDEHEPLARLGADEVTLSLGVADSLGLVAAPQERDDDPARERDQAEAVRALEAEDADIVRDGRDLGLMLGVFQSCERTSCCDSISQPCTLV
jgi:hypothetical protein